MHRRFQFGILDLLILTSVVAVVISLCRPGQTNETKAPPWVVGLWETDPRHTQGSLLHLYPDGYYRGLSLLGVADDRGFGWSLSSHKRLKNAFVLECRQHRFIVRSEWGSGVMDLLNEDGTVRSQLWQDMRFEGPTRGGVPHGKWAYIHPSGRKAGWIEFRNGEPVDFRWPNGDRDLTSINSLRSERGLSKLTEHDFSGGVKIVPAYPLGL